MGCAARPWEAAPRLTAVATAVAVLVEGRARGRPKQMRIVHASVVLTFIMNVHTAVVHVPCCCCCSTQRAHTLRTPKHEGHCGTPRPAESPKHKNRQCVLVHSWPLSCRTDGSQRDHPMRRRCLIWPIVRCPSQVRPHAVSVAYSTPATQRSSTQRRPLSLARQFRSLLHACHPALLNVVPPSPRLSAA